MADMGLRINGEMFDAFVGALCHLGRDGCLSTCPRGVTNPLAPLRKLNHLKQQPRYSSCTMRRNALHKESGQLYPWYLQRTVL